MAKINNANGDENMISAKDIIKNTNASVYVVRKPYNSEYQDEERITFFNSIEKIFDELEKQNG